MRACKDEQSNVKIAWLHCSACCTADVKCTCIMFQAVAVFNLGAKAGAHTAISTRPVDYRKCLKGRL